MMVREQGKKERKRGLTRPSLYCMYACMYARRENQNPNTMLNLTDQRPGLVCIIHSFSSLRRERPTVQNNEEKKRAKEGLLLV